MERRDFLSLSGVTTLWLLTGCGGSSGTTGTMTSMISTSAIDTTNEPLTKLTIPPLLSPTDIGGIKNYNLTIQESNHTFIQGYTTATYAVNGTYLAPTLKVTNGDTVSINYTNNLTESTTMHGHGMHVPPTMDGAGHQPIAVGATWSAQYTVNQRASTNWYHPHTVGKTAQHVFKGLAGLIILEDTEILTLDLPKTYGVDDIPLIVQDRIFDINGQLDYSPSTHEITVGYKGDTSIVNGVVNPYVEVEAKEVRFRILNGSNASVYTFSFSDGRSFKQIGTDNSLLNAPASMTSLRVSPAERAEIVVDFSASTGQVLTLSNGSKNILQINVNTLTSAVTTTPATLTTLAVNSITSAVKTRTFSLAASGPADLRINGVAFDSNVINERVLVNQIEVWEVTNTMSIEHNFHIHATHFSIAERNGSSANVLASEQGYKDTVYLAGGDTVKLVVKMVDYTDVAVPYMYHCHFLEHEDAGMMGQFTVE